MWFFRKEYKERVLQGRTIIYMAKKKIFTVRPYLTDILNGKVGCSERMARSIVTCINEFEKVEDYFYKKGE